MRKNVMFFGEELVPVLHEEMDRRNRRCFGMCCNEEDEECSSFITDEDVPDLDVDILAEVDRRLRGRYIQDSELLDFIGQPCNCPEDFREMELNPEKHGMIDVACVDVRNGVIYLLKNDNPPKEYNKPIYMQPEKRRLAGKELYEDKHFTRSHDNLKTMPELKVQRMHRGELRAIMGKF